jgi:hypothetical protein
MPSRRLNGYEFPCRICGSLPGAEKSFDLLVDGERELLGRVNPLEILEHRHPLSPRLSMHLPNDARLADPALGCHDYAVPLQDVLEVGDQAIAAEDLVYR